MTQIDGLAFTQLTNLNVTGEIYEHGEPFGGVNAPLTLSTANNVAQRPLTLRGGATVALQDYDPINSGLIFNDGDDTEIWRLWGSAKDLSLFAGFEAGSTYSNNPGVLGENTAFGGASMVLLDDGEFNTAMGLRALRDNVSGIQNTAVGHETLKTAIGSNNTGVGQWVMTSSGHTGSGNTGLGRNSLFALTTGSNNLALGNNAGFNLLTGSGNIYIGDVTAFALDESNLLNIGGLIQGDMAAGEVFLNLPTIPGTTGSLYSNSGIVTVVT